MKELILRKATEGDICALGNHHAKMFEEIFLISGNPLHEDVLIALRQKYHEKLESQLSTGECQAIIAENKENIIASGAFTVASYVPTPKDISNNVAYIHSVYTEKKYRKKGVSSKILFNLKELCLEANLKRIYLFSSKSGEQLYKKLGFESAPDAMRVFL